MRLYRSSVLLLTVTILITLLGACSSPKKSKSPEETSRLLKERAKTYWQFRKDFKFQEAYDLELPSYHKTATLAEYIELLSGGKTRWLKIDIVNTKIDGNKAVVTMNVRYRHMSPFFPARGVAMRMSDQWEYVHDNWYHVPHTLRPLKVLPTTEK